MENQEKQLRKITFFVRKYRTKTDNKEFTTIRIKGSFVPADINHKLPIDPEAYYRLSLIGFTTPNKEGKYHTFYQEGWVDERKDTKGNVIRLKGASGFVFDEALKEKAESQGEAVLD